jgi:hypothetical protein
MVSGLVGFAYRPISLCLLLFSVSLSLAQQVATDDHLSLEFLRSQITLGYSAASARSFLDVDGSYNSSTISCSATIPLYGSLSNQAKGTFSYFVLARGQFSYFRPAISFLSSSSSVYLAKVGLTGGIATTARHVYLLTLNAGLAENGNKLSNARTRPTGSLIGKYQLDDAFAFVYGMSYSYTFNRGLLLPVLGTHCTLVKDLQLHLVLPFSMELEYADVHSLHFGFVARANGNQIHVQENGYFGQQSSPLYLKVSQIQLAFSVSFEVAEKLWLYGEAGVLRNRNLAIGPLDHNLVSSRIQNSGYSSVILKYSIDRFSSWLE